MSNRDKMNRPQIKVELTEEIGKGIYANFSIVTHSAAEFVIDFTRLLPGIPKANVLSRIIMTPLHAKSFLLTLQENIKRFEAEHGEIKVPSHPDQTFGITPPPDTLPN